MKADLDKLLVRTEIVMRRTDKYDSTVSGALEDAVKNVIVNTTIDDDLGLEVNENSVSVGGKSSGVCFDVCCEELLIYSTCVFFCGCYLL